MAIAGLASLFGACVDALESLLSAAPAGAFGDHVRVEIEVEKVRLMAWGEVIGLTSSTTTPTPGRPSEVLQRPAMRTTIQTMLVLVIDIFDGDDLPELYGISKEASGTFAPRPDQNRDTLGAVFPQTYARYQGHRATNSAAAQTFRYSIQDEQKFMALISELGGINDNLCAMFPKVAEGVEAQLLAEVAQCSDRGAMDRLLRAPAGLHESVVGAATHRFASLPEPSTAPPTVAAAAPAVDAAGPAAPAEAHRKYVGTSSASPTWHQQGPSQPPPSQPSQTLPIHTRPVEQTPSPRPTSYQRPAASSPAPYDDTGALVINRTNVDNRILSLSARHTGFNEVPAEYVHPVLHPSFGKSTLSPS